MYFMSDSMVSGRKFRTLNIIDDCTREVPAIEIDTSLSAKRVTRVLARMNMERGKPEKIRVDNGAEFTRTNLQHGQKRTTSLFNTRSLAMCRMVLLSVLTNYTEKRFWDAYLFSLDEVRLLTAEWMEEYNERRPHEALDNMTPQEYKNKADEKKKHQSNTV